MPLMASRDFPAGIAVASRNGQLRPGIQINPGGQARNVSQINAAGGGPANIGNWNPS